jgi:hypothetical protein
MCSPAHKLTRVLAHIIHDGSSGPHPSLPHNMGEGWVGAHDKREERDLRDV